MAADKTGIPVTPTRPPFMLRAPPKLQLIRGSFCGQQYDLRSVAGLELPHDVPDMHLDGAFAHAELVSDCLVLLARPSPSNTWI